MNNILSTITGKISYKMSSNNLEKIHTEKEEEGACLIEKPLAYFPLNIMNIKIEYLILLKYCQW